MTKKLLFVLTILLVAAFGASAADISGKWTAEQPGRNGGAPRVTTFTFKVDGAKLTGSMSRPGRGGDPMVSEITDGKVDGNNVTFSVKMSMGGQDMVSTYKGTVSGDTIELETTRPGQDGTPMVQKMTAKRATT
ncbi:MAG TPA: hypothetical protein VG456_27180 [Candidatus Sulfopaludibacter sp.]|jgi:hypothetical protein|nr:hypothetical protein [Candidatus Sulfopaludibacter sp.]